MFFKIETIEAEGLSRYTPEEVIRTTGIQLEENLFRVDDRKVSQALVDTYPYIESVQLRRNLPSKLTLKITEAEPLGTFLQEDGSYVVVSGKGRVLELGSGTPPDGILVVNGVSIEGAQLCQDIPEENNESLGMLRYLVEAINTTGFERITRIDLSDRLNMYIVYEDRVKIELGSENQLEDKLDFAKYALDNNVREDFEGIMDVHHGQEDQHGRRRSMIRITMTKVWSLNRRKGRNRRANLRSRPNRSRKKPARDRQRKSLPSRRKTADRAAFRHLPQILRIMMEVQHSQVENPVVFIEPLQYLG